MRQNPLNFAAFMIIFAMCVERVKIFGLIILNNELMTSVTYDSHPGSQFLTSASTSSSSSCTVARAGPLSGIKLIRMFTNYSYVYLCPVHRACWS